MRLRATAKRLAHQFVRLRTSFHKKLQRQREFARMLKAAEIRSPAETHVTAIHEAGHAVLQIALHLDFAAVSIIPNLRDGADGQIFGATGDATAELPMAARKAFCLRYAMVCYAGAEAVRQSIPTHPNPDEGTRADRRYAAKLITRHIGGDPESIDLLFALAKRRCALLVEQYRPEIRAVAEALEAKLILSAKAVRKVFMRSLTKRSGRLMSFKTDPTLEGLAGDEAYQAFMRRMNLPG